MLFIIFQSRIALAEQLRKGKELTQKVGPSLNETDSDNSDDEQNEVPEQVIDPDNPWLAERKEFTDFIAGYSHFVQNNGDISDKNDEIEKKKKIDNENNDSTINDLNDGKIEEPIRKNKNKKKIEKNVSRSKVKNITVKDLAVLSDEESDVEVLNIVNPQKNKIRFSKDNVKPETKTKINEIDNSTKLHNKKINDVEVIHTVAGTWFVSSEKQSINNINSKSSKNQDINNVGSKNKKKNKIHKDVQNAFETVETELKNTINLKLEKLNKVEVKESKKNFVKRKDREVDNNYLKMSNKRTKAEFKEPLYEDNKTLDKIDSSNREDNQGLSIEILDKSTKLVQNIDPTEFLEVTQTNLETEEMTRIEDHLDDKEYNEQEKLIAEAFADDDIINEFKYY